MKWVDVRYFAALRDSRGVSEETVETAATTVKELYLELAELHGLKVNANLIRFVKVDSFCEATEPVISGDIIEFLPPASGG